MRRREFISGFGSAVLARPLAAHAQQQTMPMVGFLRSTSAAGSPHLVKAFRQGLGDTGFVEGENVAVEYRWGDDRRERLPGLAADLIRRQPAVIVTNGGAVAALKPATTTIPIVFMTGLDPVRTGLVTNVSRPGGNVTGVVFTVVDLVTKQLGLLHELVPNASVIAVLADPNQPEHALEMKQAEAAGRAIGRELLIVKAANEHEFDAAFTKIVQAKAHAVLVRGGPAFLTRHRQLVALVARHALPATFVSREYAEAGGLMSYGPSLTYAYRRVGIYTGRILKGEKPGDLPVEFATRFDLVINLATAKGLGIDIPPMLLARADEVIE
jgi:putative tryptophan/tyrosine transport system substrate-binding protein